MLIGNFLKNIKKEFKNHQFAGLSFNSEDCKKNYIFFVLQIYRCDSEKQGVGMKLFTELKCNG